MRPAYAYRLSCPLCGLHLNIAPAEGHGGNNANNTTALGAMFFSAMRPFKECPGWSEMRVVTWNANTSSPRATLHRVTELRYQRRDTTIWVGHSAAVAACKLGWNADTGEYTFVCDGACWDMAAARFSPANCSSNDDDGEVVLATRLARIMFSLNPGRSPRQAWFNLLSTPSSTSTSAFASTSAEEPRRPGTQADVYSTLEVDAATLGQNLERLAHESKARRDRQASSAMPPGARRRRPWMLSLRRNMFARLPQELLLLVLDFVRVVDLPRLRLASREVAGVSTLDQLAPSFWRARFHDEQAHMVPAALDGSEDWRALMFACPPLWRPRYGADTDSSTTQVMGGGPPTDAATERELIWRGLDGVGQLVNKTLQGLPAEEDDLWESCDDLGLMRFKPDLVSPNPLRLCAGIHPIVPRPLKRWPRRLPWLSRDYELRGISVTTSTIGTKSFISGLRQWHPKEGQSTLVSDEIGYISPEAETTFHFSETDELRGIRMIYAENAAVGVKFIVRDHGTDRIRETDWSREPGGLGTTQTVTLFRRFSWAPFSIIGSFDYCGLISLSVFGCANVAW